MQWQAPALSVAAQSFLIAVGVNTDLNTAVRVLALLLAMASAVLSMQLMAKQRFHEQIDTAYLRAWERQSAATTPVAGLAPHDHAINSGKADRLGISVGWWVRRSSYRWWMWGLRAFLAATLGLLGWVLLS